MAVWGIMACLLKFVSLHQTVLSQIPCKPAETCEWYLQCRVMRTSKSWIRGEPDTHVAPSVSRLSRHTYTCICDHVFTLRAMLRHPLARSECPMPLGTQVLSKSAAGRVVNPCWQSTDLKFDAIARSNAPPHRSINCGLSTLSFILNYMMFLRMACTYDEVKERRKHGYLHLLGFSVIAWVDGISWFTTNDFKFIA